MVDDSHLIGTDGVSPTLPTILIFLFLQRYFVEGVQGFALKG